MVGRLLLATPLSPTIFGTGHLRPADITWTKFPFWAAAWRCGKVCPRLSVGCLCGIDECSYFSATCHSRAELWSRILLMSKTSDSEIWRKIQHTLNSTLFLSWREMTLVNWYRAWRKACESGTSKRALGDKHFRLSPSPITGFCQHEVVHKSRRGGARQGLPAVR